MPAILPLLRRITIVMLALLLALAGCTTPSDSWPEAMRQTTPTATEVPTPSTGPSDTPTPPIVQTTPTATVTPTPSPSLTPTVVATATPGAGEAGYLIFGWGNNLFMVDARCARVPLGCDTDWIRLTSGDRQDSLDIGGVYPVYGIAGSPDGKKLAFVFNTEKITADEAPWGNFDIYALDIDVCRRTARGCTPAQFTRLTTDPADDLYPAWSSDGQTIAFTSERGKAGDPSRGFHGLPRIFTMRPDGSDQKLLLDERVSGSLAGMEMPTWSPDDGTLALVVREDRLDPPAKETLYTVRRDGSDLTLLASAIPFPAGREKELGGYGTYIKPQWSPDGQSILFYRQFPGLDGLYILDVPTGRAQRVDVTRSNPNAASWEPFGSAAWSPSGQQILCHGSVDPDGVLSLFVMNADGTNLLRLTSRGYIYDSIWVR